MGYRGASKTSRCLGEKLAPSSFFTAGFIRHLVTASPLTRFRQRESRADGNVSRRFRKLSCLWGGDLPLRARCQSSWGPAGMRVAGGRRGSGRWKWGRGQTPASAPRRTGRRGDWASGKGRRGGGSRGGGWRCPWRRVGVRVSWLLSSFSCGCSQPLIYSVL